MLELGRKLVGELGLDESTDTLARWMAQHLAQLIHDAESVQAEDRPGRMRECSEAILKLWRHCHELPDGKRPFEDLEPVLRALNSLDPNDDTPRYFRGMRPPGSETEQETEARKRLDTADATDCTAKILIRRCLAQAAEAALDKSKEWVTLAERSGIDAEDLALIIRFIAQESELTKEAKLNEEAREIIRGRIQRLNKFRQIAGTLEAELRAELQELDSFSETS